MANKGVVLEKKVQEGQAQNAKGIKHKKQTKYVNPILAWGLVLAAFVIAAVIGIMVIPPIA